MRAQYEDPPRFRATAGAEQSRCTCCHVLSHRSRTLAIRLQIMLARDPSGYRTGVLSLSCPTRSRDSREIGRQSRGISPPRVFVGTCNVRTTDDTTNDDDDQRCGERRISAGRDYWSIARRQGSVSRRVTSSKIEVRPRRPSSGRENRSDANRDAFINSRCGCIVTATTMVPRDAQDRSSMRVRVRVTRFLADTVTCLTHHRVGSVGPSLLEVTSVRRALKLLTVTRLTGRTYARVVGGSPWEMVGRMKNRRNNPIERDWNSVSIGRVAAAYVKRISQADKHTVLRNTHHDSR